MARRLVLIRHAEVGSVAKDVYLGRFDVALSDDGLRQARMLAPRLREIQAGRCFFSPLRRVQQTAALAMDSAIQCEVDPDLREVDFGEWEGRSFADIAASHPPAVASWSAFAPDFGFPGGERLADFLTRVGRAADLLAGDPAETVVAFTHGGVIRATICHLLGLDPRHYILFRIDPASITTIDLFDGKGVLAGLNDRQHLARF